MSTFHGTARSTVLGVIPERSPTGQPIRKRRQNVGKASGRSVPGMVVVAVLGQPLAIAESVSVKSTKAESGGCVQIVRFGLVQVRAVHYRAVA